MTELEIDKKNVMIARFLGWFQTEHQGPGSWFKTTDCAIVVAYSSYNNYPHQDLPFRRDWIWLMQALDKIEELGYYTEISNTGTHWEDDTKSHHICAIYTDQHNRLPECVRKFGNSKKEAVWEAVSNFARKYLDKELPEAKKR